MSISQVFVITDRLPWESVSFERSSCNRNCTSLGTLSRADNLFNYAGFIKCVSWLTHYEFRGYCDGFLQILDTRHAHRFPRCGRDKQRYEFQAPRTLR